MGFDLLVDITCVDYLDYRGATHRFGLVYLLANIETPSERLTVRVLVDEPELTVPSLVPVVGRGQLAGAGGLGPVRDSL